MVKTVKPNVEGQCTDQGDVYIIKAYGLHINEIAALARAIQSPGKRSGQLAVVAGFIVQGLFSK